MNRLCGRIEEVKGLLMEREEVRLGGAIRWYLVGRIENRLRVVTQIRGWIGTRISRQIDGRAIT